MRAEGVATVMALLLLPWPMVATTPPQPALLLLLLQWHIAVWNLIRETFNFQNRFEVLQGQGNTFSNSSPASRKKRTPILFIQEWAKALFSLTTTLQQIHILRIRDKPALQLQLQTLVNMKKLAVSIFWHDIVRGHTLITLAHKGTYFVCKMLTTLL